MCFKSKLFFKVNLVEFLPIGSAYFCWFGSRSKEPKYCGSGSEVLHLNIHIMNFFIFRSGLGAENFFKINLNSMSNLPPPLQAVQQQSGQPQAASTPQSVASTILHPQGTLESNYSIPLTLISQSQDIPDFEGKS